MKEILKNLNWKSCHIGTVNHKFNNAKILDITDKFILIEDENSEKVLINLDFVRVVVEAKEGRSLPVFVPHDI